MTIVSMITENPVLTYLYDTIAQRYSISYFGLTDKFYSSIVHKFCFLSRLKFN